MKCQGKVRLQSLGLAACIAFGQTDLLRRSRYPMLDVPMSLSSMQPLWLEGSCPDIPEYGFTKSAAAANDCEVKLLPRKVGKELFCQQLKDCSWLKLGCPVVEQVDNMRYFLTGCKTLQAVEVSLL